MADLCLEEVGLVRCILYDKEGDKIDSVSIKPKDMNKPYPLPQKLVRAAVSLVNRKRISLEEKH